MNAEEIFLAALEKLTSAERAAYLDGACGPDAELRVVVEGLLKSHEAAGGFLEQPLFQPAPIVVPLPNHEGPGTIIGPYKLLQQIGEGGFGAVFMAEQQQPVRRKVALKVIKAGMDTRQVITRFEAERQALAMMDHVNIARVLDAGATEAGRPYFVMELVHGVPITKYCDENRLTPRERLELFVPVCQAIQHAHQKGVIHRDVKPSNVMITLYDGKPVPKVIDFGVAKATEQKLTERTMFTNYGMIVGTLEYMSPEQAEMSALGVDTRSDIYSLGVLLYELLTGSTPLSQKRLKEAAYGEIVRMIKEEEPPKPSTRLSDSGEALVSISAQRHMEPAKLTKLVRGELDWIVMKTLEKDRNRRYETANGLAADVRRYLNDEPVQACPPSTWYRMRKFSRRNKRELATAALLGVMLLAAVGAVAGSMGREMRDRAARRRVVTQSVDLALEEGQGWQEKEKWPEVLAQVTRAEVILADDAGDEDLRERVRQARRDIEVVLRLERTLFDLTTLRQDPSQFDFVKPDLDYSQAYREYGIDVDVLDRETAAALIRRRPIRLQLALGLDGWAETRRFAGRSSRPSRHETTPWRDLLSLAAAVDPDPWRCQVREALRNRSQAALLQVVGQIPFGEAPPVTLGLLGRALNDAGAVQEAEALFRRAQRLHPGSFWLNFDLAISCSLQTPVHSEEAVRFFSMAMALRPDNVNARAHLGSALLQRGQTDEALAEFCQIIALDPNSALAWVYRGNAYHGLHQYDKAIADFSKAIELDATYASAWVHRGNSYHDLRQYEKAIADHGKAIELDPTGRWAHLCRGVAYRDVHQDDKAVADFSKAIELDPTNATGWTWRGNAYHELRQYDKAIADFSKAIELDGKNATTWIWRGNSYHDSLQYDKAIADHGKALELDPNFSWALLCRAVAFGDLHDYGNAIADLSTAVELSPLDSALTNRLAWLLATCSDPELRNADRAVELGEKAVRLSPDSGNNWNTLGAARYRAGAWSDAIAASEKSMELRQGGDAFDWFFLAMAHERLGDKEQACKWYDQAVEWMEKNNPQDEELRRFRAEAAELLQTTEAPRKASLPGQ